MKLKLYKVVFNYARDGIARLAGFLVSLSNSRSGRLIVVPVSIFAAFSVIGTWPIILHLSDRLIGMPGDAYIMPWSLWWAKRSLLDLQANPFFTQYLFYPNTVPLTLHAWDPAVSISSILLQPFFSVVTLTNLLVIASYVLAAYFAFRLALDITNNWRASLLCGVSFAFSFIRYTQLSGQYNLLFSFFFPLSVLVLRKCLESRSYRPAFLLSLVLILSMYTDLVLFAMTLIVDAVYLVAFLATSRLRELRDSFSLASMKRFLPLTVVAVAAVPLLVSLSKHYSVGGLAPTREFTERYSSDLLAFFTPSIFSPLPPYKSLSHNLWQTYGTHTDGIRVFLGFMSLLLSLLALVLSFRKKDTKIALLGAFVFAVLVLGPALYVAGSRTVAPLPYQVLLNIPVVNMLREPYRLGMALSLFVSLLVSYGFLAVEPNLRRIRPYLPLTVFVLLSLIIPLETHDFFGKLGLVDASVPPVYSLVKAEKGEWVLLDIPLGGESGEPGVSYGERVPYEYLLYQTVHQKKMLGGHVTKLNPDMLKVYRDDRGLAYFYLPEKFGQNDDFAYDTAAVLETMEKFNIGYIVIHRKLLSAKTVDKLERLFEEDLGLQPVYRDRSEQLYSVKELKRPPTTFVKGRVKQWNPVVFDDASVFLLSKEDDMFVAQVKLGPGKVAGVMSSEPIDISQIEAYSISLHGMENELYLAFIDFVDPQAKSYYRVAEEVGWQGWREVVHNVRDLRLVKEAPDSRYPDLSRVFVKITFGSGQGMEGTLRFSDMAFSP